MVESLENSIEVAKFGGSSLADQVRRDNARKIILGEYDGIERRDVVVSAPGRKSNGSEKPSDKLERIGRRETDDVTSRNQLAK